jgi:dimethylargininase
LKSAVTAVARKTLLLNRAWVDPGAFGDVRLIDVDLDEPAAANALLLGDRVIFPTSFPSTGRRLAAAGIRVASVEVSELQKAEGGVTCCSVIYEASAAPLTLP